MDAGDGRGVGTETRSRAAACEPLSLLNIPTLLETLPVTSYFGNMPEESGGAVTEW